MSVEVNHCCAKMHNGIALAVVETEFWAGIFFGDWATGEVCL